MAACPLVSIIVPVYKVEKYLRRCLDSIVGQTLADIEIICVDDGSPDACPQILDEYAAADSRIKVIHKQNGGLSSARNAGMEVSTAPYIGFVDSDDWIEPETFECAVKIMLNDDEIDFVQWNLRVHNEETGAVDLSMTELQNRRTAMYPGKQPLTASIKTTLPYPAWQKLCRGSLLRNNGITFIDGVQYEDVAFCWELFAYARYVYILDKVFSNYLIRPDSITGETVKKIAKGPLDYLLILRYIYDLYIRKDLYQANISILHDLFINLSTVGYQYTADPEAYREMTLGLIRKYNLPQRKFKKLIKRIKRPPDYKRPEYTTLEKIFSMKNVGEDKVIRFLGIALKFKRKKRPIS